MAADQKPSHGQRMIQSRARLFARWCRILGSSAGLGFSDPAQERRFHQARVEWLRPRVLPIAVLIACVFMAFILFDRAFAPEHAAALSLVRASTALLLIGFGLLSHFRPALISMTATTTLIAAIIYAGVFSTHVVVGASSVHRFTEAVMLIQIGTWFLGGMTFAAATLVNAVALVVYLVLVVIVIKVPLHDVWQTAMYVGSLGLISGYSAYGLERLLRHNFASNELLAEQKREYRIRAMRDALTGLWNRAAMEERIEAACRRTGVTGEGGAVCMIDLDRFKPVNDQYGHQAGDEVLIAIARRIQSALRPSDSVGRIGGDEFLVLVEDLSAVETAGQLAGRIRREIESPIRVRLYGDSASVAVTVGASIGICRFSGDVVLPGEIINSADLDMYRDKARRKGAPAETR